MSFGWLRCMGNTLSRSGLRLVPLGFGASVIGVLDLFRISCFDFRVFSPRSPRAAAPRGSSGVTTYEKRSSNFVASFVGRFVVKARDKARDKVPTSALSLAYLALWRFATTTITTS